MTRIWIIAPDMRLVDTGEKHCVELSNEDRADALGVAPWELLSGWTEGAVTISETLYPAALRALADYTMEHVKPDEERP